MVKPVFKQFFFSLEIRFHLLLHGWLHSKVLLYFLSLQASTEKVLSFNPDTAIFTLQMQPSPLQLFCASFCTLVYTAAYQPLENKQHCKHRSSTGAEGMIQGTCVGKLTHSMWMETKICFLLSSGWAAASHQVLGFHIHFHLLPKDHLQGLGSQTPH